MPLITKLKFEIERLNATNSLLHMEVSRLEHALTTVEVLQATLMAPKILVFDEDHDLTSRETEVLVLIMKGASTKEIAKTLFMSPNTVKSHIQKIYKKLSVHNRGGAAMAGAHLGLSQTAA